MSLQFIIDNLCANFTIKSMYRLMERMVADGPCTVRQIAVGIADADRTLDIGSAQTLAEGAVETLAESGVIFVHDGHVSRAD